MSRVAVVTGSNKGIGFAIVRSLCKNFEGDVFLTSRNKERGQEAVKKLESEGLKPKFHLLDIEEQKSIDAIRDFMVKEYGGVDVFIHNAAIAYKGADPAPFREQATVTIKSNFTATLYICNTILPIMKEDGRFVSVSSWVSLIALGKCSTQIQDYFKSPDLTEENLVKKMDEFVAAAQDGAHEEKGFASTAYGMSKLGVTALTRILGRKRPSCANLVSWSIALVPVG